MQDAIDKLNTQYGAQVPMPKILWDLRGKSRLGMAYGWETIHLNLQYAAALGREVSRSARNLLTPKLERRILRS